MASRGSANPAPVRERSRSPRSQPLVIKSLGGDVVFKLDEGESGLTVHDCIVAVMQKAFRPDWKYYFVAAEKQLGSALQGIMQSSSRVLPWQLWGNAILCRGPGPPTGSAALVVFWDLPSKFDEKLDKHVSKT